MTASVVASQEDAEFRDEVLPQEDFEKVFLDASTLCLEVTAEECWMAFVEDDTIIQRGAGQNDSRKRGGRSQENNYEQESILDDYGTVESSLTLHTFEDYPDQITKNLLRNRKQNLLDLNETETVGTDKVLHQKRVEEVKDTIKEEKKKNETRDEPSTRAPRRSSKTKASKDKEVRIDSPSVKTRAKSPVPHQATRDKEVRTESPSVKTRAKSPVPHQSIRDDKSVYTTSTHKIRDDKSVYTTSTRKIRDDKSVYTTSTRRSRRRNPIKEVNRQAKKVERAKSPFGRRGKGAFLVVEAS